MMGAPFKKPATYADLEALPEHLVGEIIDGALHAQARPRLRHGAASVRLGSELDFPFGRGRGGPGGWVFIAEPQLHLGLQILVPDLAGWRRERAVFDLDDAKVSIAADWICEVISPSTAQLDRGRKSKIYALAGIGYYWVLDPANRTLEAYRRNDFEWTLMGSAGHGENVSFEPFEAISFAFDDLFPLDPPISGLST
jgi:Uma2 family endonuclease